MSEPIQVTVRRHDPSAHRTDLPIIENGKCVEQPRPVRHVVWNRVPIGQYFVGGTFDCRA